MHASGERHYKWNGGSYISSSGYMLVYSPKHPMAGARNYVLEHILIAEKTLGKRLPKHAVVHHIDGNKLNNLPNNLVICENTAYHLFLHRRNRAFRATGNPFLLWCCRCNQYLDPVLFYDKISNKFKGKTESCIKCCKEQAIEYYNNNKSKALKKMSEYRDKNKTKLHEYFLTRKQNESENEKNTRKEKDRNRKRIEYQKKKEAEHA